MSITSTACPHAQYAHPKPNPSFSTESLALQESIYAMYMALQAIVAVTPSGVQPTLEQMYPLADAISQFATNYNQSPPASGSQAQALYNLITEDATSYRGNTILQISQNVLNPPPQSTRVIWEEELTKCYGNDNPVSGLWQMYSTLNNPIPPPAYNETLPDSIKSNLTTLQNEWGQINPNNINPSNSGFLQQLAQDVVNLNNSLQDAGNQVANEQVLSDALNAPLDEQNNNDCSLVTDAKALLAPNNPSLKDYATFSGDLNQVNNYQAGVFADALNPPQGS